MLTEKELEVLQRRARGDSQAHIAKALRISQAAVSKFETNAHRKIIEAETLSTIVSKLCIHTEEGLTGSKVRYGGGKQ
ncbi:helix-turn-helix domain-containing protein [Candidatus Woesearchaeota archaeon]|nr:helix-turn-helix domain-containing protein [Candidatus Woesearchaeota archaeon]